MRLIVFLIVLQLTACNTIFLAGTLVTAASFLPTQERTLGNIVDDSTLLWQIKKELLNMPSLRKVHLTISEGRVLLTGSVETPFDRIIASKVVWDVRGVEEVMNELEVQKNEPSYIESAWITAQIKTSILLKSSIRSFNYSVETFEGTVFLMGIALSKEELKKVIYIAKKTLGVKKVVSYVRLKDSILRAKK